jgi:hypothetical protein
VRLHRAGTLVLSLLLVALGLVAIARTAQLGSGGGLGYVLGSLFVAAGAGRLYLLRR